MFSNFYYLKKKSYIQKVFIKTLIFVENFSMFSRCNSKILNLLNLSINRLIELIMLYLFRLLLLLINIDQETVLNWFGVEDRANQEISQAAGNGYALNLSNLEPSTDVSLNTLRLIVEGLWDKIQDGLTDIENVLFFIVLFVSLYLHYGII
jgi:hypothetical protein